MKKLLYVLLSLVIACAVGAAACNDNRTPITISIEGAAERTLVEGETLQLEVNTNSSETVTWSSSSEANATVSAAGLVTAVAEGSAVITASAEGQSASVTVRVERDTSLEGAYSLSFEEDGAGVNLEREDAYTIRPVLKYGSDRVDGATFTFSSSDPEIAAVNETTGEVTALSAGQATITVTYTPEEGNPVSAVFTVTVLRDLSFEISSDEEDLSLSADDEDKTVTLTATVKETTDDGETDIPAGEIVWSSSDETVATVNENGVVTAVGHGTATITASYDIGSVSCEVSVWDKYLADTEDFLAMYSVKNWTSAWFMMTDNISLPENVNYEANTIAGGVPYFTGVFDGGNKTLSGVPVRIFAGVDGGTVRNLNIEGDAGYWGGVFGDFFNSGLVENITATLTFTQTEASGTTNGYFKRANGGLFNFASGGTFRNVTVYADIPDDIDTENMVEHKTVAGMSVFGKCDATAATFENCVAYVNDMSIQFASGAQKNQFVNCTGAVQGWYADYKVEHYVPNEDGTDFTLQKTEELQGLYNKTVTAEEMAIDGLVFASEYGMNVKSGVVDLEGTLVLKLYYTWNDLEIVTDMGETSEVLSAAEEQGNTWQLSAKAMRGDSPVDNATIVWTSDDDAIASVNASGLVTGLKGGKTYIRANYMGAAYAFEVTVYTRYIITEADFLSMYSNVGSEDAFKWGYEDSWYLMKDNITITDPTWGVQEVVIATNRPIVAFNGVFDGGGYTLNNVGSRIFNGLNGATIRNLKVNGSMSSWSGLFGDSIENSIIEDVEVRLTLLTSYGNYHTTNYTSRPLGALANYIYSGTFTNVTVYTDIPADIITTTYPEGITRPVSEISAFGNVTDHVGAATFTNCAAYSNDTSIQFTLGEDNGTVQAWSANYTVEHYIYGDSGYELYGEEQVLSGLYNKTVTAEPIEIEGYAFNEGYAGNVTSGVVTLDGALVLKLYYMPENVSMEATSATEFDLSLTSGQTGTAQAAVSAEDNGEPVVSGIAWSSSDDEIATVDDNGNITAVGHGEAVITASYRGFTCDFTVTVYDMFITSDADFGTMYETLAGLPAGTAENSVYFDNWYKMTADVTLTTDYESRVIYDASHGFAGVFDGGGYTLRGLTHRLMVNMVEGGIIRNLNIESAAVDAWAGVLGDSMAGGLVENVTVSVKITQTMANGDAVNWFTRAAGGVYNIINNGTLRNVTVYVNIPDNILISTDTSGNTFTVEMMSAFGMVSLSQNGVVTFENCVAYSSDTRLNFAAGVQSSQLVNSTGTVQQTPSENLSLAAGQTNTAQLSVEGTEVSYTSANPEIATVSETGLVTAVAHGNVFIYAVSDGQLHVFDITVYDGILSTTDDFTAMYADASYYSKWYMLANDIALASNFEQTVIYQASNFSGVFDGNGHTLSNLQSRLFQGLDGAAVKDIVIEGTVGTWGGVFGWVITGNSVLQNIQATVTLSTTWTLYTAQSMDINWSCGALTSNLQASSFMDVTVYVNIPEDINTDTYNGSPRPVTEVSAFGDMTGYTPVFTNCSAYSNDTTIQFAKGGTGTVQEWVQQ